MSSDANSPQNGFNKTYNNVKKKNKSYNCKIETYVLIDNNLDYRQIAVDWCLLRMKNVQLNIRVRVQRLRKKL